VKGEDQGDAVKSNVRSVQAFSCQPLKSNCLEPRNKQHNAVRLKVSVVTRGGGDTSVLILNPKAMCDTDLQNCDVM